MSLNDLEIGGLQWRKARCSANNGACVEAALSNGRILIRDSKDPGGPILGYRSSAWRIFTSEARIGHYDKFRMKEWTKN